MCGRPKRGAFPFPLQGDVALRQGVEKTEALRRTVFGTAENESNSLIFSELLSSAGEGTRTHTPEAPDPKSGLSTNFNTPAGFFAKIEILQQNHIKMLQKFIKNHSSSGAGIFFEYSRHLAISAHISSGSGASK